MQTADGFWVRTIEQQQHQHQRLAQPPRTGRTALHAGQADYMGYSGQTGWPHPALTRTTTVSSFSATPLWGEMAV